MCPVADEAGYRQNRRHMRIHSKSNKRFRPIVRFVLRWNNMQPLVL